MLFRSRPVIDGVVVGKSAFRGTPIYDVGVFAEGRLPISNRVVLLRVEGFNIFNHANVFGRNGVLGDTGTPLPTFGQATPGLASMEPPRMFQFQVRFQF